MKSKAAVLHAASWRLCEALLHFVIIYFLVEPPLTPISPTPPLSRAQMVENRGCRLGETVFFNVQYFVI